VIVPFTEVFANQLAEEYVKDFLVKKFRPKMLIIGYDHRFGRDRQGDYRLLENLAPELGFELQEIPKHIVDEISISSTNIREAILHGDISTANKLLGYKFFFEGEVVEGDKLGRKLGYPTANLRIADPEKIIPGDGIYAVYSELLRRKTLNDEKFHTLPVLQRNLRKGMMSIGFRPTVNGKHRVIEVNIFDFKEHIYGQTLRVYVKKYLRPEKRFESLEALVAQIDNDKEESLKVL
jgi:riboflavin kinase/FMN adenylyltransferase